MADLDRKIGELIGKLDALGPTLARFEKSRDKVTAVSAELLGLKASLDDFKDAARGNWKSLYEKCEQIRAEFRNELDGKLDAEEVDPKHIAELYNDLVVLRKELHDLKTKYEKAKEGFSKKVWEVVKLLLAAGLAAGGTYLMGKGA